jgi:hypothetical protein
MNRKVSDQPEKPHHPHKALLPAQQVNHLPLLVLHHVQLVKQPHKEVHLVQQASHSQPVHQRLSTSPLAQSQLHRSLVQVVPPLPFLTLLLFLLLLAQSSAKSGPLDSPQQADTLRSAWLGST